MSNWSRKKNLELESFLTTPNLNNFQPPESCKILGPDFENLCFDIISDVVEPKPAQDNMLRDKTY